MTYEYENIVRIIFSTIAIISILLHVSNMSLELKSYSQEAILSTYIKTIINGKTLLSTLELPKYV